MVQLVMVNEEFKTSFICWLRYLETGFLHIELPPIKKYEFTFYLSHEKRV
jgi:hypothetical protein